MNNINALEFERTNIFKRLKILKFLSIIEALIMLYLAFVMSKDLIISFVIAVFVGVFFYRFLSRKLLARQNAIDNELLMHFLVQNKAQFKGIGLDEQALQKLALPFENIKTSSGVEFPHFLLYDISFKNASNCTFIGILLVLKKARFKDELNSVDENALFQRLHSTEFDTQKIFIKDEFALIATLTNPFFVNAKLNLSQNLAQMKANLTKIENLIL